MEICQVMTFFVALLLLLSIFLETPCIRNMRFAWIIFIGLSLVVPFALSAQNTAWQALTIADGLSQGMVYDFLQDRTGFMWIATKDGLNRYDGYNFKVFTHDPYDPHSISGNTCTVLLEDSRGRLWIGTEKDGLNLYDPHSQKFFRAEVSDQHNNTGNYSIIDLKEDQQGKIWIITDTPGKIFCIAIPAKTPTKANFRNWLKLVPQGLPSHIELIFNRRGLNYLRLKGLYQNHQNFPAQHEISTVKPQEFGCLKDQQGRFWALSLDTLICWQGKRIKVLPFEKKDVTELSQLADGRLAICNSTYLWLFKPEELLQQQSLTPDNAYANLPPNIHSIAIIGEDASGNIWAGTRGYGLLRFNPLVKKFHSFLAGYSLSALYQDRQGQVYFHGNYRPGYRFFKLNQKTGQIDPIPAEIQAPLWAHDVMMQDAAGHFWVMTHYGNEVSHLLIKFTSDWQLIKKYSIPAGIEEPAIYQTTNFHYQICQGQDQNIYLGWTNGKLLQFDPQKESFTVFDYRKKLPEQGTLVETFALHQGHDGVWWIGTQRGLIKAENLGAKTTFSVYKNDPTKRKSLSNDFVSGMIDDPAKPDQYLWISTKGGGLERLNKKTGEFDHFTEAQGLPNKVVYGVVEGEDKNLWMSTNRGLARLNLKTLTFNNFNKSDGLQEDEFNTNSYFQGPAGDLLFGGINGITIFRPSKLVERKKMPDIRLLDIKINNKPVPIESGGLLPKAIEYLPQLQLAHHQNLLSFEFGLMDFTNPVKNRYRYQLEGIDQDWVEAGTQRFASYAHLRSGSYTFRVMGSTNGEQWSQPIALSFYIHPPFYLSWWAYAIYVIIISGLAYFWYKIQLNRVRLEEQVLYQGLEATRLAELDTLKTRFFTNISHEFRTPLTLLLGPIADLLKKYPEETLLPLMQRNASRLQTLINQLLDLSKLEAGQMELHLQEADLARFINNVLTSFESLAQSRNIHFEHTQSYATFTTRFDADKLEKILSNLLSNAFKFTPPGGKVNLDLDYTPQNVHLRIQDTGIGIAAGRLPRIFDRFYQVDDSQKRDYEGTGIGLALVKELVSVWQGDIQVESVEGEGTTFSLVLPHWPAATPAALVVQPLSKIVPVVETPLAATPVATSDERELLLVVEDNADLRAYIQEIFAQNYQVIEAKDGQEGLEKAFEFLPDLVICDLMMPRLDGLGFCQTIKTNPLSNHIPVIMLTARATLEDRLEGLELGADDYLAKPFNRSELEVRVRNLIRQRQLLQQKYSPASPAEAKTKVLSMDEKFLQQTLEVIDQYLDQSNFDVETFAQAMHLTPIQLRRKLKALTDQTITEYVRNHRLDKAAMLLRSKAGTVSQIAYQVGFESLSYFSKMFFEKFGKSPSEWE